jgi:RHS repeat-associated protein
VARYEVDPDGTFYRIEENADGSEDRVEIEPEEAALGLDPQQNPVPQLIHDFLHDGLIDRSTGEILDASDPRDQQAFADAVLTPVVRALEQHLADGRIDGAELGERLHQLLGDETRIILTFVRRVAPRDIDARDLAVGIWGERAAGIVGSLDPDTPTDAKADDPVDTSKPGFRPPVSNGPGDPGDARESGSGDTGSSNLGDSTQGGDPVRLATGELVHEVVDLRLRGRGLHLAFKRTYRNQVLYKGPLGYNWDHSYNLWLREERHADGAAGLVDVVVRSTGGLRSDVFTRRLDPALDPHLPLDGALEAVFDPPAGTFDRLEKRGGFYRLTTPMGTRFEYDERLMCRRIVDLNDNAIDLVYDAGGRLVLVRDPVGKTLELSYDPAGRIEWLHDTVGDRRWRYSYSDNGDLMEVDVWAEPDRVGTTDYRYVGADAPLEIQHSLVEVIDATGTTVLFNEYGFEAGSGTFNRVVRQRAGGGEWRYEYRFVSELPAGPDEAAVLGWTVVTSPAGQRVAHGIGPRGQIVRREEQVAEGGPVRTLIASYRYDEWGLLRSETMADGSRIDYEYTGHRLRERLGPDALLDPDERAVAGDLVRTVRHPVPGSGDSRRLVLDYEYAERSQVGGARRIRCVRGPYFADPTLVELPGQTVREATCEYDGLGNLVAVRHPPVARPDGSTLQPLPILYRYDGPPGMPTEIETGDLLARISYPVTERRSGFVSQVVEDPAGLARTTAYEVDDLGRVTRLIESSGAVITTEWNGFDQPARMLLPPPGPGAAPAERTFAYDVLRRPVRVWESCLMPDGSEAPGGSRIEERRFDVEGRLISRSVADGHGRVLEREATQYDAAGRAVHRFDSRGVVSQFDYSSRGLVLAIERGRGTPAASRRRFEYDDGGRPITTTDGRGASTRHGYDGFGRLVATRDADGVEIRTERDAEGRVTRRSVWDAAASPAVRCSELRYRHDGLGRIIEAAEMLFEPGSEEERSLATRFFYDAASHLERIERPDGSSDSFVFDALGRLVRRETDDGRTIEIEHDDAAREIRVTTKHRGVDADGGPLTQVTRTVQRLDSRGLTIEAIDSAGNVERRSYDSAGDLIAVTDAGGGRSVWVRDALGRTIEHRRRVEGGDAVIRLRYDEQGRIVALEDPNGDQTLFEHDALGRVVTTIRPGGARCGKILDAEGNAIEERDENGTIVRREFTPGGRLARRLVDASAAALPAGQVLPVGEERFTWSPLGRILIAVNDVAVVRRAYDSLGLPRWEEIDGRRVEMEWDDGGRLRRLRWPDGRAVRYDRRPGGAVDAVVDEDRGSFYPGRTAARPVTLLKARRVTDRATGFDLGPLKVHISHEARRLPVSAVWSLAGSPVHDERRLYGPRGEVMLSESGDRRRFWRFDPALRLVAWQDELGAAPTDVAGLAPARDASGLDHMGQERARALVPRVGDPALRVAYTLDTNDNRLEERIDEGGVSESIAYRVGVADRYEQVGGRTLTHDEAGRRLRDDALLLSYDGLGRIARTELRGVRRELAYDALGRLHRVGDVNGAAVRLHYVGDQAVEWREENAGAPTGQIVPVRGRALHVATGGRDIFPIHDVGGDLVAWVDEAGVIGRRTYAPFGQVLASSGDWPVALGYGGHREEPTGVVLYPERAYDASTGRFLQPDPAGFVDGTNLYSLARHAPGARCDPAGLAAIDIDWGTVADEAGATFRSVGDFVFGALSQGRQTFGLMAGMGYASLAFPPAWLVVGGYLGWSMVSAEYDSLGGGAWGVFGAVNSLNPVYMLLRSGHSAITAFEDGDYRKAGGASFDTVFTAVTSAFGAKAAPGLPGRLGAVRQRLASGVGEIRTGARARFSTRFWEELADAAPLTEEQYLHPTPGDPILLSPYEGGMIRFDADLVLSLPGEMWRRLMRERGTELGAHSLGLREWVVTEAAVEHYRATDDMSRILAEEMPYIEQASHIYFFVTNDMHTRPITLREFEIVMDDPKLRAKTTFIPRD